MFSINLQWKDFNVNLAAVEAWMRANAGEFYVGNSADTDLRFWFSQDPGHTVVATVHAYWDSLNDSCPEAINYVSRDSINSAIAVLRAGLIDKTWDSMSSTERKLVIGQSVTLEDLGFSTEFHIIPFDFEGYGD